MRRIISLSLLVACLLTLMATGSMAAEPDATDLAKVAQNPLATMVTLPLQFNWNSGVGEYGRTLFNLNVQPVIPFKGTKWNVINRPIIPINSAPTGETESSFGIGDINYQILFTPAKGGGCYLGTGSGFVPSDRFEP